MNTNTETMNQSLLETGERGAYRAPLVRVRNTRYEAAFLLSGGNGDIDSGEEDLWGDL